MQLYSGITNRVTLSLAEKGYVTFAREIKVMKSPSQPTKTVFQVMNEAVKKKRSEAELTATAWAAHCDEEVRYAGAYPPNGKWKDVFLEGPELCMLIFSTHCAHGGAPFPLEIPENEEDEIDVPDNLFRLNFHDYFGSHIQPAADGERILDVSRAQESTVDIRTDPHLCPACEYWGASDWDASFKKFT